MSDYFHSIISDSNINAALLTVNRKGSAGPDGILPDQAVEDFKAHSEQIVHDLSMSAYHPMPAGRIYHGEKKRPLDLLNVQDRIVQRMFSQVLSEAFDPMFSDSSHGFRNGRGRHTAMRKALDLINSGSVFLLQLDISKCFQNIDRQILMDLLQRTVSEPEILNFISASISAGYVENGRLFTSEKGIPQGSSLSPILSNVYLNELDRELDSRKIPFIRFADDILILTDSQQKAEVVKAYLEGWLPSVLRLQLSREKTRIVGPENCQILGYRLIQKDGVWISDPPLPEPKARNRTTSLTKNRDYASDKEIPVSENKALEGLNTLNLSGYKNKWIPKDKAVSIRNAVNQQFSIAEMAKALGFTVLKHSSETLTLQEHDSCIIWPDTNRFKRFSQTDSNGRTVGGGPLDFYMHFKQVPYFQALSIFESRIDKTGSRSVIHSKPIQKQEPVTPLQRDLQLHDELKKRDRSKDDGMRNVFAYLIKTRKIDPDIVSEQVKRGCIQQITDEKGYTYCIFIGRDENSLYSGICFRSTSSTNKFMGDFPGCDYSHGWFYDPEWDQSSLCMLDKATLPNPDKPLLCFESYIEMLSYMTILKQQGFDYRKFAYLSCGSVTKLQAINDTCERYGYRKIKIMFNNDLEQEKQNGKNPGKEAAERAAGSLLEKGYDASILLPKQENDWNDTLKSGRFKNPVQKRARTTDITK